MSNTDAQIGVSGSHGGSPSQVGSPGDSTPVSRRRRRILRWTARGIGVLLLALVAGGTWAWARLRASLPVIDGTMALPGSSAPVTIERDSLGVPTVRGATRVDVARALGFIHAQDRFFQMDLSRRRAAGELAELFGPAALELDRSTRRHRLRAVAERAVAALPPTQRDALQAYAEGVRSGLAALHERPFEYLLLRQEPVPWRPEDSMLAVLAMFIELSAESVAHEVVLGAMHDALPPAVFDLLAPIGGSWDAPLVGGPMNPAAVPGPEVLDFRKLAYLRSMHDRAVESTRLALAAQSDVGRDETPLAASMGDGLGDAAAGSNSWAVDGAHSAHGGALLADDMHLGLAVPNTWYRASLVWNDAARERRVTGVTLPGLPGVIVGSNGDVAWGFTNSYGDWADLVVIEEAGADEYLTPAGPRPFEHATETLHVRGGPDETLDVLGTIWGPVIDKDHLGRKRALAWTAHRPGGVNLELLALERAASVDEALAVANRSGIPPQNFLCADRAGRIGWTIAGIIPRRVGFDGRVPASWADGTRRWDGWRAPEETPRIVDPGSGRLWTANARVVNGEALAIIGDGGYGLGARARQIRDDLMARERLSEHDLLAIQLDDQAKFLARWQSLLLDVLGPAAVAGDPRRAEVRRLVETWSGRASIDSAGYRIVRAWRSAVTARVLAPFVAMVKRVDSRFDASALWQAEDAVWTLVTTRPQHMLAPAEGSWDRLLLASLDDALTSIPRADRSLAQRTWGERNTTSIRHPLSAALPFAGRLLDMPAEELPGDANMPRVQGPSFGASERLVVSPGREDQGLFHMPGGQSGHPLSPFYRAGHEAWAHGEATPFLPGPAAHVLTLDP